ncbi:MAG: SRPBCC domain-containing protein [Adhaeribacter sp.]
MNAYKKYYLIPADPEEVYKALTNPDEIRFWTGEEALMSTEPGSEFELFEGSIAGKNLAFDTNRKIEQEWYFGEQEAPSLVTIKLHPHRKGTSVELHHTNIPEEAYADITEGWDQAYFGNLQAYFEED